MSVKSFTIYKEFNDLIKLLKDETKEARLIYAIWKYMFEDEYIVLDNEQQAIFDNLKRPLNKIKTKSKNKLNKIKNKSKQNQNENETKTHQDVNVNVYVNDNVLEEKDNKSLREEEKEETNIYEDRFNDFWSKYPKKNKKAKSKEWYLKNKPSKELHEKIVWSLVFFRDSEDWKKNNGQFIPDPTTFLNQKRWEDYVNDK